MAGLKTRYLELEIEFSNRAKEVNKEQDRKESQYQPVIPYEQSVLLRFSPCCNGEPTYGYAVFNGIGGSCRRANHNKLNGVLPGKSKSTEQLGCCRSV